MDSKRRDLPHSTEVIDEGNKKKSRLVDDIYSKIDREIYKKAIQPIMGNKAFDLFDQAANSVYDLIQKARLEIEK